MANGYDLSKALGIFSGGLVQELEKKKEQEKLKQMIEQKDRELRFNVLKSILNNPDKYSPDVVNAAMKAAATEFPELTGLTETPYQAPPEPSVAEKGLETLGGLPVSVLQSLLKGLGVIPEDEATKAKIETERARKAYWEAQMRKAMQGSARGGKEEADTGIGALAKEYEALLKLQSAGFPLTPEQEDRMYLLQGILLNPDLFEEYKETTLSDLAGKIKTPRRRLTPEQMKEISKFVLDLKMRGMKAGIPMDEIKQNIDKQLREKYKISWDEFYHQYKGK